MRKNIRLSEGWRFHLGDTADAYYMGFDDRGWRQVTVPHDWAVEHPFDPCWASGTFGKDADAYDIDRGEKLFAVIAVGYGTTNGNPHKSKSFDDVVKGKDLPDWFTAGANAALQAPTAMNRQPFTLSLGKKDKVVLDKASGLDRGILKYNFEVGAAAKGCKKVDWK